MGHCWFARDIMAAMLDHDNKAFIIRFSCLGLIATQQYIKNVNRKIYKLRHILLLDLTNTLQTTKTIWITKQELSLEDLGLVRNLAYKPVRGKYIGRLGTSAMTIEIAVLQFYYIQFKNCIAYPMYWKNNVESIQVIFPLVFHKGQTPRKTCN